MLSVVVTVVEAGEALEECLQALEHQEQAPELQILVPYDDTVQGMDALRAAHPRVEFLALGQVPTEHDARSPAGAHELFDRRRAAGLKAARGDLIAIVEDRGIPRADWASRFVELHARLPHAVIGGAVECGFEDPLAWAVYFCDFGRYQLPFEAGPAEYVTDVNVCYKRAALEATRELWQERYHETLVHWNLRERGETLYLTPEVVVDQRRRVLDLPTMMAERYHWGRLFAYTRVKHAPTSERLKFLAGSPLLPAMLLARHGRMQLSKRARLAKFLKVAPLVGTLLVPWSVGEAVGYVTGKA